MNANFPIFCRTLPAGEFSILAPYFSLQTVQFTALSDILLNNIPWVGTSGSDPGSVAFFTPGSWMGIKSGSGMNILDTGSYLRELRKNICGLKFLNSLMRIRIRDLLDPGSVMENFGFKIRNKYPGPATLVGTIDK
jgi:hypothetical protein